LKNTSDMEPILSALADNARLHILELLATRPRSVGELAELVGLRQPQATKHLQTLARAGLVTVFSVGQRRIYAVETGPLEDLQRRVTALVETAIAHQFERDIIERYRAAVEADSAVASRKSWADGRTFLFERLLNAPSDQVWRHWTDSALLAGWWSPPSMTIVKCMLEPWKGGRAVLEYRDAEGRYRSEGSVLKAAEPRNLVFDLSVLDDSGEVSFSGHYTLNLADVDGRTALRLTLHIDATTVDALPYIAGIETGWGTVLDQLVGAVDAHHQTAK